MSVFEPAAVDGAPGSDTPLDPAFFARPTLEVAPELLGAELVRGPVRLRIVEVEAYLPDDSACHARMGRTPRNAPMWGPPGHAYVYLCYGIHHLLNLVTERDGVPGAVLIRGAEVRAGHDIVRRRRGGRLDCIGPGKVAQALGLTTAFSGRALGDGRPDALTVVAGPRPDDIRCTPRIGIDYARPEHRAAPWRFITAPVRR
ncbi:MAG: DNA-3-methyladenine glycosylase [Deltaproteobacteria bacterium]|nr:MAG: DNA-3-methyladenine glycosylase [Deltaproteobacteria bacterium]